MTLIINEDRTFSVFDSGFAQFGQEKGPDDFALMMNEPLESTTIVYVQLQKNDMPVTAFLRGGREDNFSADGQPASTVTGVLNNEIVILECKFDSSLIPNDISTWRLGNVKTQTGYTSEIVKQSPRIISQPYAYVETGFPVPSGLGSDFSIEFYAPTTTTVIAEGADSVVTYLAPSGKVRVQTSTADFTTEEVYESNQWHRLSLVETGSFDVELNEIVVFTKIPGDSSLRKVGALKTKMLQTSDKVLGTTLSWSMASDKPEISILSKPLKVERVTDAGPPPPQTNIPEPVLMSSNVSPEVVTLGGPVRATWVTNDVKSRSSYRIRISDGTTVLTEKKVDAVGGEIMTDLTVATTSHTFTLVARRFGRETVYPALQVGTVELPDAVTVQGPEGVVNGTVQTTLVFDKDLPADAFDSVSPPGILTLGSPPETPNVRQLVMNYTARSTSEIVTVVLKGPDMFQKSYNLSLTAVTFPEVVGTTCVPSPATLGDTVTFTTTFDSPVPNSTVPITITSSGAESAVVTATGTGNTLSYMYQVTSDTNHEAMYALELNGVEHEYSWIAPVLQSDSIHTPPHIVTVDGKVKEAESGQLTIRLTGGEGMGGGNVLSVKQGSAPLAMQQGSASNEVVITTTIQAADLPVALLVSLQIYGFEVKLTGHITSANLAPTFDYSVWEQAYDLDGFVSSGTEPESIPSIGSIQTGVDAKVRTVVNPQYKTKNGISVLLQPTDANYQTNNIYFRVPATANGLESGSPFHVVYVWKQGRFVNSYPVILRMQDTKHSDLSSNYPKTTGNTEWFHRESHQGGRIVFRQQQGRNPYTDTQALGAFNYIDLIENDIYILSHSRQISSGTERATTTLHHYSASSSQWRSVTSAGDEVISRPTDMFITDWGHYAFAHPSIRSNEYCPCTFLFHTTPVPEHLFLPQLKERWQKFAG